jgi:hypothetical protein
MKIARKLTMAALGGTLLPGAAVAQVPDLLAAFDAGGRAMGMGGATYGTGSETLSSYYNPAGLGYLNRPQVGVSIRNLPRSTTIVTGQLGEGTERHATTAERGQMALTHAGLALPLRRRGGGGGTLGIALTTTGYIEDEARAGTGLTSGGLDFGGFGENRKSRTDVISISYGQATPDQYATWGVGLLFALNHQRYLSNRFGLADVSTNSTGLGLVAGFQMVPRNNPNMNFGVSVQTPISLSRRGGDALIYSRIPGRITGSMGWRRDGLRGGRDFLLAGVDINHFFGREGGRMFGNRSQTTAGAGFEYNYALGGARVPVRVGYNFVPGGGELFGSRNTFTFGLGYRPANGNWGIDVNFGQPQVGGGTDMGVNLFYRFGG